MWERGDDFKAIWLSMVIPTFKLIFTIEVRSERDSSLGRTVIILGSLGIFQKL